LINDDTDDDRRRPTRDYSLLSSHKDFFFAVVEITERWFEYGGMLWRPAVGLAACLHSLFAALFSLREELDLCSHAIVRLWLIGQGSRTASIDPSSNKIDIDHGRNPP
jgi:hypothetical protein